MRFHALIVLSLVGASAVAVAAPPPPSAAHPRLFMSAAEKTAYAAKAQDPTSAASARVAACQRTIDHPEDLTSRGGTDADTWPAAAVTCAFAYRLTQDQKYLTQAIKYWQGALNDDQTLGDGLACVPGVDTAWQAWAAAGGSGSWPPILTTILHDTGYPMRWYGPYLSLTYDWLYDAPGVTDQLRTQTRTCLTAWMDYYTRYGFNRALAGANYNAGFVIGKVLSGIAIGADGGADGHLWSEAVDDQFGQLIVGQGLKGLTDGVGTPAGPLVGGDTPEGWQYGSLSVTEYALAARAIEANGQSLPETHTWVDSLIVRFLYGLVPQKDGQWIGGDFDSTDPYQVPTGGPITAVLLGPSSDQTVAWALAAQQDLKLTNGSSIYSAFAEIRTGTPEDYRTQTPAPPLWYYAHGTRTMYLRSSWGADAFWGVFTSPPYMLDHQHFSASNFAFSRGGDHLVIDSSQYGAPGSFETNAATADSRVVTGAYAPSQTPWSLADLPWVRASSSNVFAARSDFAHAFDFSDTPSDIPYAHRDWVFLPEGEMVMIDRVETADAAHMMYVNFHTYSGGTLKLAAGVATGTVGGSKVVIHPVLLSGGTPVISAPGGIGDSSNCAGSYPNGACTNARFPVDIYALKVPGPAATAIHVIDGLATAEEAPTVASLNDPTYDPMSQNGGVIGAAVYRSMKQSYVVASSAPRGASGATMTYSVPAMPGRHIVFDAPEAADGSSTVAATAQGDRCVVTVTAGAGGGFVGHPLMFQVDKSCAVTESTDVPSASPPPAPTTGSGGAGPVGGGGGTVGGGGGTVGGGGGTVGTGGGPGGSGTGKAGGTGSAAGEAGTGGGGCGCVMAPTETLSPFWLLGIGVVLRLRRSGRRPGPKVDRLARFR